eukprot:3259353-Rhodomonas_salina.2
MQPRVRRQRDPRHLPWTVGRAPNHRPQQRDEPGRDRARAALLRKGVCGAAGNFHRRHLQLNRNPERVHCDPDHGGGGACRGGAAVAVCGSGPSDPRACSDNLLHQEQGMHPCKPCYTSCTLASHLHSYPTHPSTALGRLEASTVCDCLLYTSDAADDM